MSRVIGVFSAKGGVGKSLIASNLGVAFCVGHKLKTIILDLTPGTGTVDLLLDLDPERTWMDLIPVMNELRPKHFQLSTTAFRNGLDILACPSETIFDKKIKKGQLRSLFTALRNEYDLVVIDTHTGLGKLSQTAYEFASLRLVILTPDAPALRSTSRFVRSGFRSDQRMGLVINQHSPGSAIDPQEIQQHLDRKLWGVLPMDPSSAWANVSYGKPCVLRKKSPFGKSLRQLSTRLVKSLGQAAGDEIPPEK